MKDPDCAYLERYAEAWNAHDIETIMSMMTEDCVFLTGGGEGSSGSRYEGAESVRERFVEVWTEFPDVRFEDARHFVDGDRGCSEWTFVATNPDGFRLEFDGCDLFDFRDGKIRVKNSYIKNVKPNSR